LAARIGVSSSEPTIRARLLEGNQWRDLLPGEDDRQLIDKGSLRLWIDILASPDEAQLKLRRLTDRCRQLTDVDPRRATKGGDYPPKFPPRAKAFKDCIFARAYWLGATGTSHKIKGQEIHILAGERFAVTLRYPTRIWDIRTPKFEPGWDDGGLEPDKIEADIISLRRRLERSDVPYDTIGQQPKDVFGLEVAVVLLDQVIDSVFESLDAIRLFADNLEGTLMEGTEENGASGGRGPEAIPQETLHLRRLLRQVRWAFLPSEEVGELHSGPFMNLNKYPGIEWQINDLSREADRAVVTVRDVIEQVQQVVELNNSLKTDRLDQTIYVLTVAATVLLVPTLLAGIWGMNFARIPGTGYDEGFWLALLVLAGMAASAAMVISAYLARSTKSRKRDR